MLTATKIICATALIATTWAAVAVMAWEAWRYEDKGFWGTLCDDGVFLTAAIAAYATVAAVALATWG